MSNGSDDLSHLKGETMYARDVAQLGERGVFH